MAYVEILAAFQLAVMAVVTTVPNAISGVALRIIPAILALALAVDGMSRAGWV